MKKTLIVLLDGTEIFSGVGVSNAITSRKITKTVNDGTELNVGSVCSSMLEVNIIIPNGNLSISEGSDITVFEVDDSGNREQIGIFRVEKPVRATANKYNITAYDHVVKLDKDVTEWFNALDAWPYTLYDFAVLLCAECGLTLRNASIPNGDRLIPKFSASGITGRRLMKYVAQAACRFGRATVDGQFELAWYTDTGKSIGTSDFYQNSLSYEDYETYPIERVQIRYTESDIGTRYPTDGGENTYPIEGNPLLTSSGAEDLLPVAETIFNELAGVAFTPCKCSLFYPSGVSAGDIISITDKNGKTIRVYVMSSIVNNQKQNIECFGSYRLDSVTIKNNETLVDRLYGKTLELEATVDGALVRVTDLQAEIDRNSEETARQIAEISVKADGITSEVSNQAKELENLREDVTTVQQTASNVNIQVQSIIDNGVDKVKTKMGYSFDDEGLHIAKDGDEIESLLDNRGLYVARGDQVMLKADADGVEATDVKVNNYLIIAHSRFEKYSNGTDTKRTGLFWVKEG